MTAIRRTLLWVVFTMSLVLLWDAWNKHTGQPTIFGGPAQPTAAAGAAPGAPASGVPAATPARRGWGLQRILQHYYPGTALVPLTGLQSEAPPVIPERHP